MERRIITVPKTVYIAYDGREFDNERDCVRYEDRSREDIRNRCLGSPDVTHREDLDDFLPFDGGEWYESWEYYWVMPNTEKGVGEISRAFNVTIDSSDIGRWICLAVGEDVTEVVYLDDCIGYTKSICGAFDMEGWR